MGWPVRSARGGSADAGGDRKTGRAKPASPKRTAGLCLSGFASFLGQTGFWSRRCRCRPAAGQAAGRRLLFAVRPRHMLCGARRIGRAPGRRLAQLVEHTVLHTGVGGSNTVTAHQTARPPDCLATKLPAHKAAGAVTEMGRPRRRLGPFAPTDSSGAERAQAGGRRRRPRRRAPGGSARGKPLPRCRSGEGASTTLDSLPSTVYLPASRRTAWPSDPGGVAGVSPSVG